MTAPRDDLRSWLGRRNLVRFELGCMAFFHITVALVILLLPRQMIVTPATAAIFGTIPPAAWFVWFAATGCAAVFATVHMSGVALWLTWCGVFPLGGSWVYGLAVPTVGGGGNAIFVVTWVALLTWWGITAIRLHVSGAGARWDGD